MFSVVHLHKVELFKTFSTVVGMPTMHHQCPLMLLTLGKNEWLPFTLSDQHMNNSHVDTFKMAIVWNFTLVLA